MHRYVAGSDPYLRPIPLHQQVLLKTLKRIWRDDHRPLILDSGCGRGMSTLWLQRQFPQCRVLGLDRSLHRLQQAKLPMLADNLWGAEGGPVLARANVIDFWRLLADEAWPIVCHCVWYPNPWPKRKHVQRRFHAHPVFPAMLALSPLCELRTQWLLYAEEFVASVRLHAPAHHVTLARLPTSHAQSHFECKYQQAGCPLWQVKVIKNGHSPLLGF
jgi:tRNA (guanine-N7-)-methyltransferase